MSTDAKPAAPSTTDLQSKAKGLRRSQTRESIAGDVEPAVAELYKKTYEDNAGDKAKICVALQLDESQWVEGGADKFVARYLGGAVKSQPGDKKKKGKGKGKGKDGKGKGKKGKSWDFSGPTGSGQGYRLNVKNLSKDVTSKEDLTKMFEPFGTVSSAEIKTRDDGSSMGFGFVVLANEAEAKKAIAALNGKTQGGKELNVAPAERRQTDDGSKGYGKGAWGADMASQQAAWAMQFWAMQQAFMAQSMQAWGADPNAMNANPEYEGSLKSISAKNGYGFIVCAETYAIHQRDVYIDKELLPAGAKPADRLRFTVVLNNKGHPKAATANLVTM